MLFCMKRGFPNVKRHPHSRRITGYIVLGLLTTILYQPVVAFSLTDVPGPINDAAMQLVQFCIEPKAGLDEHAVATLVDYVLSSKQNREYALLNSQNCSGPIMNSTQRSLFLGLWNTRITLSFHL